MILTFLPKKSQLSVLLAQVFYVTGKNPTASQYRACFQALTVSLYNHFNRREGIRVSGLLLRSIHVLRVYFGSLKTSCVKYSVSLLIAVNVLKRMCDAQMKVAWRLPELIEKGDILHKLFKCVSGVFHAHMKFANWIRIISMGLR